MAGDAKPYDPEPVYYQAVALSNLPPTYENQKALYDISQLDNCDKASNYADNVLIAMRKEVERLHRLYRVQNISRRENHTDNDPLA